MPGDEKHETRNILALLKDKTPPVHVCVLCPPQTAVTVLLNRMIAHGGFYVCSQGFPIQRGKTLGADGKPQIEIWMGYVFSIDRKVFETWTKLTYDEVAMYNFEDIVK
jgi:hypothetical protein